MDTPPASSDPETPDLDTLDLDTPDLAGAVLGASEPAFPGSLMPENGVAPAYRVLARKYRPQTFADLIGQAPMVRTLRNAFESGRIHQAYILTGVRGVGKTTTARILARALNYETDTVHAPTIDMPVLGKHCAAIIESRHVDVIEMDAASNTSINNIREIIEASRYKPVSARMKVYIIDEVHMLSNAAFNGLLKTLEEPPEHVKFVFATTEIRKVPITVLSRCQRFDLRRIEIPDMIAYLQGIVAKEGVVVEDQALALIARASEGSMRDALSLLDQAIAHGRGHVRAEEVRSALGLADRTQILDLFEAVMGGDISRALDLFAAQYDQGAGAGAILTDLAEYTHLVTRLKLVKSAAEDPALGETERRRGSESAQALSVRALAMAWQILLKGLAEVEAAPRAKAAAEMVLVRLAYAADLPSPGDLAREVRASGANGRAGASGGARAGVSAGNAVAGYGHAGAAGGGGSSASGSAGSSGFADGAGGATAFGRQVQEESPPNERGYLAERGQFAEQGRGAAALAAHPFAVAAQGAPQARDLPDTLRAAPTMALVPKLAASATDAASAGAARAAASMRSSIAAGTAPLHHFADLVALAGEKREIALKIAMERDMRVLTFEPGRIEFMPTDTAPADLANRLAKALLDWTGQRWGITVARPRSGDAPLTLHEIERAKKDNALRDVEALPIVQAVFEAFPGARIVSVTPAPVLAAPEAGIAGAEPLSEDAETGDEFPLAPFEDDA